MAEEDGCRRRMLQTRARRWPAMLLRLHLVLPDEHANDDEHCRVYAMKLLRCSPHEQWTNGCVAAWTTIRIRHDKRCCANRKSNRNPLPVLFLRPAPLAPHDEDSGVWSLDSGVGAGISAGPAGLAVLCEPILKVAVQ